MVSQYEDDDEDAPAAESSGVSAFTQMMPCVCVCQRERERHLAAASLLAAIMEEAVVALVAVGQDPRKDPHARARVLLRVGMFPSS